MKAESFGKAQRLHGATYIVDAEFGRSELDTHNRVIDIGQANRILKDVLSELDYHNLDELDPFRSQKTTAEFLAKYIHDTLSARIRSFFQGRLAVTLHESHVAWASYTAPVD